MTVHQRIGRPANRRGGWIAGFFLTLAAILVLATPSFAQAPPEKADNVATKKKKQKPVSTPGLGPSAASRAAAGPAPSQTSQTAQAIEAQSPLTPMWGIINENYTNFGMGPLHKTQNVLIAEPIIPLKLTPDWNLITRWNTPITSQPRLADPMGPFPGIGSEFGLSNMQPQFFFTPANPGSFTFAVGPALWLPTATDKTLGINKTGGGPVVVALTTQGPLLAGFLAQNIWAGTTGTSVTGERVNLLTIEPFVFYNFPEGWFLTYRPIITADWTVNDHNRWTVPVGGGFGRVFPVGDMVMDVHVQAFYNGLTAPAAGITNVGKWTALLVVHFLFPQARVPALF
jgi:hypothetical protein